VLPFRDKKKIDQVLPYELEPLIPLHADSAVIDYQHATIEGTRSVLVTAALENTALATVIDNLNDIGINPGIVTISGCPSASVLQQRLSAGNDSVFVSPTGDSTTVLLFYGKQMVHAQCLQEDIVSADPRQFAAAVKRMVHAFMDGKTGLPFSPQRIYVNEASNTPEALLALFGEECGIPAEWFHPGRANDVWMTVDSDTPPLEALPCDAFALAVNSIRGYKGLNFRKNPYVLGKLWQEHRRSLIAPVVITLLILFTAGYRSIAATSHDEAQLSTINQQIAATFKTALPDIKRMVNPALQMRTKLAELKKEAPQFDHSGQSHRIVDLLRAISANIPSNLSVILSQIVISTESIIISGDTDTFNTVNTIQQGLQKDPAFNSVSISSANQQKTGNRINFKLRIEL
jgi:Tfp pilus assembly protein PilN